MKHETGSYVESIVCLASTEGCVCQASPVLSWVQRLVAYTRPVRAGSCFSSWRHSSTRDHLVSGGRWELDTGGRVVLALGLGRSSIVRGWVEGRIVFGAAPSVRTANMTWWLACCLVPEPSSERTLQSQSWSLRLCVVLGPAVSADWLPSCAPAICVSVAVEYSVTCTCTEMDWGGGLWNWQWDSECRSCQLFHQPSPLVYLRLCWCERL